MPEVEFPPDVAEPLLDGVVPEAVAPEDAASGAAALETVASGLAVLVPVAPPPVCAEVAVGRAALVLLALPSGTVRNWSLDLPKMVSWKHR